jgi:CBS domain-containing protein
VTGAPVVDEAGDLVGMLTERDCLKLVAEGTDAQRPHGTVESLMTTDVTTTSPDMDVYYVAGLFLTKTFRRLPVIEEGRIVGAITRFDILRVMEANLR